MNPTPDRQREPSPEGRASLRARLLAAREGVTAGQYAAASVVIGTRLDELLARLAPRVVGFCWPYRGEYDCRAVVASWLAGNGQRRAALPVIVTPAAPMVFRRWSPEARMVSGRFGIPVPEDGDRLIPDLVLMPLVGFDARGYRLGYGGGYFDRTLAVIEPRPVAVGVGFELARLPRLEPEPHDIPMDFVVTEAGVFRPSAP